MRIPVSVTIAAAVFVGCFGAYRIYLGTRKPPGEDAPRRGLYAPGKRSHIFVGVIYLILSGMLIAMSFGWTPFGNQVGPTTKAPTKDTVPTKSGVPIDQLPTPKK